MLALPFRGQASETSLAVYRRPSEGERTALREEEEEAENQKEFLGSEEGEEKRISIK
jgi:hypothetical protein